MAQQNRHRRSGRRRRSRSTDVRPGRGSQGLVQRVVGNIKAFLSSTTRLVLLIGALAGAVAAVIALLPKPTDTREASFSNVTAVPRISLEHYDVEVAARGGESFWSSRPSASTGIVPYRLVADTTAPPGPAAAGAEGETSGTSASTSAEPLSGSTSTSPSASSTTTSATVSTSSTESSSLPPPEQSIGGAEVSEGTGAPEPEREEVVEALKESGISPSEESRIPQSERCQSPCETDWVVGARRSSSGLNPIIDQALVSHSPTKAAGVLAARFAHCRLEVEGHRQSPLGAKVTYDVNLDGFAGTLLTLSWSLRSLTSGQQVPRCWWEEVSVEQIRPTIDHRSFSGEFWVPMPRRRGDYHIHLVLRDAEGREYKSADSEPIIH